MGKVVVLKLNRGESQQDFAVTLTLANDGDYPFAEVSGTLPNLLEVATHHENWRAAYHELDDIRRRFGKPQPGRTSSDPKQCSKYAEALENSMKTWFKSPEFADMRVKLCTALSTFDEIRLLIQTEDSKLRQLPWHLFFENFLDDYHKAEVALSPSGYYQPQQLTSTTRRNTVRILAVLGDSTGIDTDKDKQELENLPDGAKTVFLPEPQRKELDEQLWDEQGWDILFFAGHSYSDKDFKTGYININKTDKLQISALKFALKKALARGLQLAIFNSCDGLGLARDLAELHIPQIIVMREPVPDMVAQAFLKHFLREFSRGKPLYLAVREARERLAGLESEAPNATWLPVIYQLPTQVPPTWQQLCRAKNTSSTIEQLSQPPENSLKNIPAPTQTTNKENPPASPEPGNRRNRTSQPERPPAVASPVNSTPPKSPPTPTRKVLPQEKNLEKFKPSDDSGDKSVSIKIHEAELQKYPDDSNIRCQYLGIISQFGSAEQQRDIITQTATWLESHPEERSVRTKYLTLVEKCGSAEQKRDAITQTITWLQKHRQRFQQSIREDANLRKELIPLLQKFINLGLEDALKNRDIQTTFLEIFGSFRDYLNDKYCDMLADFISQPSLNLSPYFWSQLINAANVFRDYKNDFDKAEKIYLRVLNAANSRAKKPGTDTDKLNQTIQYTHLNYARLLILRQPPQPDAAIKYLNYVLADNPNHALAQLCMAQCYQLKGKNFNDKAISYFQKASEMDKHKTGNLWYEFGCFFRDILRNKTHARKCFEESLKQKINLRACVELAELEVEDRKLARAKQLLQQGCDLERITRPEREQWRQLQRRIQAIQNQISGR